MNNVEFFNLLDYVYIALLFFSTIAGFIRGFVRDFLSTCAWFGSGFAAVFVAPHLVPFLGGVIHNLTVARSVAILVSYLTILIILLLIVGALSKNVKSGSLSGVDRAVGVLFGLFRGIGVLVCFCVLMGTFEIPRNRYAITENSKITTILFNVFKPWIPQTAKFIPGPEAKKSDSLGKGKLPIERPPLIEKDKATTESEPQEEQSSVLGEIKDFIRPRADVETTTTLPSSPPDSVPATPSKERKRKPPTRSATHHRSRRALERILRKAEKNKKRKEKTAHRQV
jgi:uncharacterized membrane protein required for colicin V production